MYEQGSVAWGPIVATSFTVTQQNLRHRTQHRLGFSARWGGCGKVSEFVHSYLIVDQSR